MSLTCPEHRSGQVQGSISQSRQNFSLTPTDPHKDSPP